MISHINVIYDIYKGLRLSVFNYILQKKSVQKAQGNGETPTTYPIPLWPFKRPLGFHCIFWISNLHSEPAVKIKDMECTQIYVGVYIN